MLNPKDLNDIAADLRELDTKSLAYRGLARLLTDAVAEAQIVATHPDTPEEKRGGFCGQARALGEFWREFEDLRTGAFRHWPEMKDWVMRQGEEMEG
jgi:hypothetical protein